MSEPEHKLRPPFKRQDHSRDSSSPGNEGSSTDEAHTPTNGHELTEIKEIPLYQFKKPGEKVCGILRRIEPEIVKGKKIAVYYIAQDETRLVKIHGTWQLNNKLSPDFLGRYLEIHFKGPNPNIVKNGNPLHEYRVMVDMKAAKRDDLVITDEDIPF